MLTIIKQRLNRYIARSKMISSCEKRSVYYFAYGANISPEFFKTRVPEFDFLGLGELKNYKFEFNVPCEYQRKGFGGIVPKNNSSVFGAIYKISPSSLEFLDWAEWVPFNFYRREKLNILIGAECVSAEVYVQQCPGTNLIPSSGYKNLIVNSLKQMKVNSDYIESISRIESQTEFPIDHSFNLENPAIPRPFAPSFYKIHDYLREWLCKYI